MSRRGADHDASGRWPGAACREQIVILGTGGTAIDFSEAALASGNEVLGFLDDDDNAKGKGLPVLGPLASWKDMPDGTRFFLGIGSVSSHQHRLEIVERLGIPEQRFATIVHPRAVLSPSARLGPGCGVLALATLGARVRMGAHVEILQLCLVGHDCCLEDGVILTGGANLAGSVHVGRCAYIGAGASVKGGARVGAGALLGMNSTLLEDLPEGAVYAGSPARLVRKTIVTA